MCISHSVMEGQRHSNTLNLRCLCLQRPKRDGAGSYLIHAIVEAAKALGGSFKLVSAKNCKGGDSTAQGTHKRMGDTNKSKSTNEHTEHKPRLNIQKNTLGPTGLYELVLVAVHMENAGTVPKRTCLNVTLLTLYSF